MYRDGIDIDNEVRDEMFEAYVDTVCNEKVQIGKLMVTIEAFLEELEKKEKHKEQQCYKKSLPTVRSTKMPQDFFKYPIYQELKEIIVSLDPEVFVPRRWEEMEIDFSNPYIRYCPLCDVYVYQVSNLFHYRKAIVENMVLAIPVSSPLLKQIEKEYHDMIENYRFVQVSRRMMQESGYREKEDFDSCDFSKILEEIKKYMSHRDWINLTYWKERYTEYGIDLEKFL